MELRLVKESFGLMSKCSFTVNFIIIWIKNNIDPFIYKKIKAEGLTPAAIADKPTLLRRASFDIIGMPAPAAIVKKYLQNNNEDAYEILVNELLATPQYGEKWAGLWMDMARYADTKGFEKMFQTPRDGKPLRPAHPTPHWQGIAGSQYTAATQEM